MCSLGQDLAHGLDETQRTRGRLQDDSRHRADDRGGKCCQAPSSASRAARPAQALLLGARALLEVLDRTIDDLPIDAPFLVGVSEKQAVIANGIDEAWDPARVRRDLVDRWLAEQVQVASARDPQPGSDVRADLLRGQ